MTARSRLVALLFTTVSVATITLGATPAVADPDPVTETATVTVSQTVSYTASESAPVTESASWGLPPITETRTDTATATATATATESATATATGTGATPEEASAAAEWSATLSATIEASIAASTQAAQDASTQAHTELVAKMIALQSDLHDQALAAARAAAFARSAAQPASTTPQPAVTNCGATITRPDGTPWTCTFDDEFSGSTLNRSLWTAWNGVNWWGESSVCFEDDPEHLSVGDGTLDLTVTTNPTGRQCTLPNGTSTPTYIGANLSTKGAFSQQYGRVEARIRYPATMGTHSNFWLYADQDAASGAEIDVAEAFGAHPDEMVGATHVTGAGRPDAGDWQTCGIPDWSAGFHTYAAQWDPQTVTFVYDDSPCWSWSMPRDTFASPGAFDQKLFLILTAMTDDGTTGPAPDATSVFPATMQVDWVRAWS